MRINEYIIIPLELKNTWFRRVGKFPVLAKLRRKRQLKSGSDFLKLIVGAEVFYVVEEIECKGTSSGLSYYLEDGYRLFLCWYNSSLVFLLCNQYDDTYPCNCSSKQNCICKSDSKRVLEIREIGKAISDTWEQIKNNLSNLSRIGEKSKIYDLCCEINLIVEKKRRKLIQCNPVHIFGLYVFKKTRLNEDPIFYANTFISQIPYNQWKMDKDIITFPDGSAKPDISCFIDSPVSIFAGQMNCSEEPNKLGLKSLIPALADWNKIQAISNKVAASQNHGLKFRDLVECRESILRAKLKPYLTIADPCNPTMTRPEKLQKKLGHCLLAKCSSTTQHDGVNALSSSDTLALLSHEIDIEQNINSIMVSVLYATLSLGLGTLFGLLLFIIEIGIDESQMLSEVSRRYTTDILAVFWGFFVIMLVTLYYITRFTIRKSFSKIHKYHSKG